MSATAAHGLATSPASDTTVWTPTCARPTGLVRPVRVDHSGVDGPTWKQANGPGFEKVGRGLYVPVPRPACVEQRILEQACRLTCARDAGRDAGRDTPPAGVVTGWAALRWRGARYFDGRTPDGGAEVPVELAVTCPAGNLRRQPGSVISRRFLGPVERECVADLPVATVQRAVFDEICRRGTLTAAVQVIDMAAAAGLISAWLFGIYAGWCNSRNGAPLVREAASLAVDESRSPRETWLRLVWELDAGLPRPLVNPRIYDLHGQLIGKPDLFDPVSGTAGEYEGDYHRAQRGQDLTREARFREHGIECVTAVGGEARDVVAARILQARRRSAFLPAGDRSWTLERPAGESAPETLDDRLERLGLVESLTRIW